MGPWCAAEGLPCWPCTSGHTPHLHHTALCYGRLHLQHKAHERHRLWAAWHMAQLDGPPLNKEALHELCLTERGQLLHEWEGAYERIEHHMREFEYKLLSASQRCPLCAGKVSQPMHKVEGNVCCSDTALLDEALERAQEHSRRSLSLYEPAVIECKLSLCKAHRIALLLWQISIARKGVLIVREHVAKGRVVVTDDLTSLVLIKRCMLLLQQMGR